MTSDGFKRRLPEHDQSAVDHLSLLQCMQARMTHTIEVNQAQWDALMKLPKYKGEMTGQIRLSSIRVYLKKELKDDDEKLA